MSTQNDRAILNSIINPIQPVDEAELFTTIEDDSREDSPDVKKAKEFEKQGVTLAESGNIDNALEMFNNAVSASPTWPSAYNNRAQAFRLMRRDKDAMNDLNLAIKLSNGEGKAATQAFCQRAMLHQIANRNEEAKSDWTRAADLGCQFAKNQLAQMNPYAALCNKMLYEAFSSLKGQHVSPKDGHN